MSENTIYVQMKQRETEYYGLCREHANQPGLIAVLTEQYIRGNAILLQRLQDALKEKQP